MAVIIFLCIIGALMVLDAGVSLYVYHVNFDQRYESYEPLMLRLSDFPGLERTRYEFPSDKGQTLVGYLYSYGTDQKGLVVIAHGYGGGGHNSYMDVADYFARHGYYVFGFDATGCDESDSIVQGGMPQGVIDLDYAIAFAEQLPQCQNLPVVLWGHSWGAYCVSAVLSYHPEVKAVIECCGFNSTWDLIENEGRKQIGSAVSLMKPFISLIEWTRFGKTASATALKGYADAPDTHVFCVAADDDAMVPAQYGYDLFYSLYQDDPRFTFTMLHAKGHDTVYTDRTYQEEFNAEFLAWVEQLGYDPEAPENQERFIQDKYNYLCENLDREKWSHSLNEELFSRFLDFYNDSLKEK